MRDIVEIIAILAAGIWAFYVFAYENRIKPSMAIPDVDITASLQKISEQNGLVAVGLHVQFRNIGTVKAHFLAFAVNVYGQRVFENQPRSTEESHPLHYEFAGYYRTSPRLPVYTYAYVTKLGDPSTTQDTELDPGTTIDNYRTFYVPRTRFDLLTVGIDAPYAKKEDMKYPTTLVRRPKGDARVVVDVDYSNIEQYNIYPVTSLDLR